MKHTNFFDILYIVNIEISPPIILMKVKPKDNTRIYMEIE